jgi:hypothetical protein
MTSGRKVQAPSLPTPEESRKRKIEAARAAIQAKVSAATGIFKTATGKDYDPGNATHLELLREIIKELEATKAFTGRD